jgi:acyl-coenzyme A thioesterase PaaI-like protein
VVDQSPCRSVGEVSVSVTPQAVNQMVAAEFPGTGNQCVELGANWALAQRICIPTDLRPGGFISGPTQFALADAVLWYLTFGAIDRIEPMSLTSELSIRYLRPAIGSVLWARGTLEAAGRRNVVGTVRIWTDDNEHKPSATAQGTYVLPATPTT